MCFAMKLSPDSQQSVHMEGKKLTGWESGKVGICRTDACAMATLFLQASINNNYNSNNKNSNSSNN